MDAPDEAQRAREQSLTDTVLASFDDTPDPRVRELITGLVAHLHAYAREVRLTEKEWSRAIDFLTAAGHITDDKRQEFILLSDVLGVSMQTITINHPADGPITESTVLGPFFVDSSPEIKNGDDLAFGASGEPCWVEGTVRDEQGRPVPGARVEVWEADDEGFYDVQYDADRHAARGHLFTDQNGGYSFWALTPTPYPIPSDGPVGQLLAATRRSPFRAPHLHFLISADGYRTLTTHIFVRGADVTADSVFGVRNSLVKSFERRSRGESTPDGRAITDTWSRVTFNVVLAMADGG